MTRKIYFVYLHCDNGTPFYVGAGSRGRAYGFRARNKGYLDLLSALRKDDRYPEVTIDSCHWEAISAGHREQELISQIGRLVTGTGPLTNLTAGGEIAVAGWRNQSVSEKLTERWKDPTYREKMESAQSSSWKNSSSRKRRCESLARGMKEVWKRPERLRQGSTQMKNLWRVPGKREELCQKISDSRRSKFGVYIEHNGSQVYINHTEKRILDALMTHSLTANEWETLAPSRETFRAAMRSLRNKGFAIILESAQGSKDGKVGLYSLASEQSRR